MAAIDKLRCNSYYEYDEFLKWCIAYYPKAIPYFISINLSYNDWQRMVRSYIKRFKTYAKRDIERLGKFKTNSEAISNLREYYLKTANYEAPLCQLRVEVDEAIENIKLTDDEIADRFEYTIATFPFKIDKKLKWICPIRFVRKYLYNQCGVKHKWEKIYKLFFKGNY